MLRRKLSSNSISGSHSSLNSLDKSETRDDVKEQELKFKKTEQETKRKKENTAIKNEKKTFGRRVSESDKINRKGYDNLLSNRFVQSFSNWNQKRSSSPKSYRRSKSYDFGSALTSNVNVNVPSFGIIDAVRNEIKDVVQKLEGENVDSSSRHRYFSDVILPENNYVSPEQYFSSFTPDASHENETIPSLGVRNVNIYEAERDHPDLEEYLKNCEKYHVNVDPSVAISLKTKWHVLQPTKSFCEGSLLPLCTILARNENVRKVNLSGAGTTKVKTTPGNGASNARILRYILSHNKVMREINISNTGLDDDGLNEICLGLQNNKSVVDLDISRNSFSSFGIHYLRDMLNVNETLKSINISRNSLGFKSIKTLRCCCAHRDLDLRVEGNYVFEEVMNSLTHGLGFVASVIGTILLMNEASLPEASPYHFWSCFIFSLSLMFLYLSSTLYHSFFMLPDAKDILQVMDHVGIYLLIAGSYSPFMMIALHHSSSANILLIMEWMSAFIGVCVSVSNSGDPDVTQKTNFFEVFIYLAMGCAVVSVWSDTTTALPETALYMLMGGGFAYIFGVIFFIAGEVKPIYHTIWHIFVMIGSCLHWLCIYNFVVGMDLNACS